MQTDIVLENPTMQKQIVIDTKFNSIVTSGWYREEALRNAYLYQIYTYIRSQENLNDPLSMNATGRLLHPSIGQTVDKIVNIQGHDFRFAIVELASPANEIRKQLLKLVESYSF
jgi:5-methylcytosine-specific restriction enzyme subunit McrC